MWKAEKRRFLSTNMGVGGYARQKRRKKEDISQIVGFFMKMCLTFKKVMNIIEMMFLSIKYAFNGKS